MATKTRSSAVAVVAGHDLKKMFLMYLVYDFHNKYIATDRCRYCRCYHEYLLIYSFKLKSAEQ